MLRTHLSIGLLGAALLQAAALAVAADPSPDTHAAQHASSSSSAASKQAATQVTAHQAQRPDSGQCLTDTGSRIPPKPGHCLPQPGHTWSQQDLKSTGQGNIGAALRQLDPTLR
jgi:hypothetical protein